MATQKTLFEAFQRLQPKEKVIPPVQELYGDIVNESIQVKGNIDKSRIEKIKNNIDTYKKYIINNLSLDEWNTKPSDIMKLNIDIIDKRSKDIQIWFKPNHNIFGGHSVIITVDDYNEPTSVHL
jgi:hypothetical protein